MNKYVVFFLNLLGTVVAKQTYIAVHNSSSNPFAIIGEAGIADVQSIMYDGNQIWSTAELNETQAIQVKKHLHPSNIFAVDDDIILPEETTHIAETTTNHTTSVAADPIFINDIPRCKAHLDNIDFVVIDSVLYATIPEFSGVKVTWGPSYLTTANRLTPCHPHGTQVASILVGNKAGITTSGNRSVYGIGVFDCTGSGRVTWMISALNHALEYAKQQKLVGRKVVVNVSGTSFINSALNAAASAVHNEGVPIVVAAGNDRWNADTNTSPASAKGVFTVASTRSPGNVLATFSNFGSTVEVYLPGTEVTTASVYSAETKKSSGTSFSCPMGAAEVALEAQIDPNATPSQLYSRVLDRTVTIPATEAMPYPMQVMLADNACPDKFLFKTRIAGKKDKNQFNQWYKVANAESREFCIQFAVKLESTAGWANIGLRSADNLQDLTQVSIGKRFGKKYMHSIMQNNNTTAVQMTTNRVAQNKPARLMQIETKNNTLLIRYNTNLGMQELIRSDVDTTQTEIAFSVGGGGKVRYSNAMRC